MGTAVEDFGLGACDVPALISWLKADLASSNAPVRNAAIGLLAVCHRQLGPGLAAMLRADVKPALMTTLEDAFAKNPQQPVSAAGHPLLMMLAQLQTVHEYLQAVPSLAAC